MTVSTTNMSVLMAASLERRLSNTYLDITRGSISLVSSFRHEQFDFTVIQPTVSSTLLGGWGGVNSESSAIFKKADFSRRKLLKKGKSRPCHSSCS
jgi:hypothetical protein